MSKLFKTKTIRRNKGFSFYTLVIIFIGTIVFYLTACDKDDPNKTAALASLTTYEVTDITQISAKSGGYITDDGGSAVTARGICWSAGQNPSVTNNKTMDGEGTGIYKSDIISLLPNTKYYVRAYAINSSGTAYGNQVTFTTPLNYVNLIQQRLDGGETPKQIFDSGLPLDSLYGKTYQGGLIFYLNTSTGNGLVVAAVNNNYYNQWGCYGTAINGADGTAIGTGEQNTIDIDAGCTTPLIAADKCANLNLNTYTDWFLPSKDELDAIYTKLALKGYGGFAQSVYWCSSEASNNSAWEQNFSNGIQVTADKSNQFLFRPVREF